MIQFINKLFWQLLIFSILTVVHLGAQALDLEDTRKLESFEMMKKAKSGGVFYDASIDFSKYKKAILFPVTYDQIKISAGAKVEYVKSWEEFGEEKWKELAEYFDAAVRKKFGKSKVLALADKPGEDVVAIQIRMTEFIPNTYNTDDPIGTVGQSFNLVGLGNLNIEAVIVDSKSKQLLAVVESLNSINSGRYTGEDNKLYRKLSWRRSFQRIVDHLHYDIKKLKRLKPVKKK